MKKSQITVNLQHRLIQHMKHTRLPLPHSLSAASTTTPSNIKPDTLSTTRTEVWEAGIGNGEADIEDEEPKWTENIGL